MYVCMYVCVCLYVCMDGWMDGWRSVGMKVCICLCYPPAHTAGLDVFMVISSTCLPLEASEYFSGCLCNMPGRCGKAHTDIQNPWTIIGRAHARILFLGTSKSRSIGH